MYLHYIVSKHIHLIQQVLPLILVLVKMTCNTCSVLYVIAIIIMIVFVIMRKAHKISITLPILSLLITGPASQTAKKDNNRSYPA